MTVLLIIILTIISFPVTAQPTNCGCFNGIGSSESDKPIITIEFGNGTTLSVCGYEEEKLGENEVLISEFNIFNCKTGEKLVEYGAIQNCLVKKSELGLTISEVKYLPAGENWKWEKVKIGLQQIFVNENELVVLEQKPAFEQVAIDQALAESFFIELTYMKGTGILANPEEIIGKLEFLALNDYENAADILFDFEKYFNFKTDGAIAEQWKDAIATVQWVKE